MATVRPARGEPEPLAVADRWGGLMARAQNGEQAAYRLLLDEATPYLRAVARRRLGQQEVDDAVQDILLSLHSVRHTYDPTRPFKPWLIAIAQRRLVDRLRRNLRRTASETPLDEDVTIADERANPQENVLDIRSLRRAVGELPARQKEAVLLLRLKEMTGREAAAASGRAEGALKVSLHRAVESLRRMLGTGWP